MKVPQEKAKSENPPDNSPLQSFTVSQLFPSNIATLENGGAGIHSPYPTLVALLKGRARLVPDGLTVSEGMVMLIPSAYPCRVLPEERFQIELASIDFSFKSHGMDISTALPMAPAMITGRPAALLADDVCTICNSAPGSPSLSRTTEHLAVGFRIANTLSIVLEWDANPQLSPPEDGELQILVSYLEANYHLPLVIDDIAAECRLSRRKTFEVASRHACRTPMRILKQIRLERSLDHLRRENVSVGGAASAVGFGDARNFSREFKKRYGLTPLQYKQQSQLNVYTESLVNKADSHMEMDRCKRAAELYLQAIDEAPPQTDLNELHYKAGLALKRAGENDKSIEAWNKVTALYYRLLIDMDTCEYLNKSTEDAQIIERLKRVCDSGDRKLRKRAVGQLGKWMLECATTQKPRAAKQYSTLAKELVGEHPELQPSLARTLFSTGQFKDVERHCPDQGFYIAAALRAMARYGEHLRRFPDMRLQNALIHLRTGNTEVVLSDYQDLPEICVRGLIDTGRAEEAVSQYPRHNAEALLALGRYEDVLHQHPDNLEMSVFALANLGREAEALEKAKPSADFTSRLLLILERTHDITSAPSREFSVQVVRAATVLQSIHALEKGDFRYGVDILESVQSITDPDYRIGHEYYEVDLIVLLIRYLLPEFSEDASHSKWPPLSSHLREVVKNWRDYYDQRLWYDARFILGEIDETEYLLQPYRLHSGLRLVLAKAIKAELDGSLRGAAEHYRTYLKTFPSLTHNHMSGPTPVVKAFIRWRLKMLEE